MRGRVLLPVLLPDPTGYCKLPPTHGPVIQGDHSWRLSGGVSGEKKYEGRKAEASMFFRKEIFAAVTVWESRPGL